jgi:hypothetical protein
MRNNRSKRALGSSPLDATGIDTPNHPIDKLLKGKLNLGPIQTVQDIYGDLTQEQLSQAIDILNQADLKQREEESAKWDAMTLREQVEYFNNTITHT